MKSSLELALCLGALALASAVPNYNPAVGKSLRLQDLSPKIKAEVAGLFREAVASTIDEQILQFLDTLISNSVGVNGVDCNQNGDQIKCCASFSFSIPFVGHFSPTACFIGKYLPDQYGIRVQITVDGDTIVDETVSAVNPPAMCAKVPEIPGEVLEVCIKASDLNLADGFHGCFDLFAEVLYTTVMDIDLGCFDI